jgi:hypothetical protein
MIEPKVRGSLVLVVRIIVPNSMKCVAELSLSSARYPCNVFKKERHFMVG